MHDNAIPFRKTVFYEIANFMLSKKFCLHTETIVPLYAVAKKAQILIVHRYFH